MMKISMTRMERELSRRIEQKEERRTSDATIVFYVLSSQLPDYSYQNKYQLDLIEPIINKVDIV